MNKIVYLSGGIMYWTDSEIHEWRETCKKNLRCETIDPTRISYKGRNPEEIVELDKRDIDSSTHLLVNFIRPSVGTSMEILYAWQNKKMVYIINSSGKELSPWLLYHSTKIFSSLDRAIESINNE